MALHFSLFVLFSLILHVTSALKNVTISHSSSSIVYKPSSSSNIWNATDSALDYSKSHVVTDVKGAAAVLTFTGNVLFKNFLVNCSNMAVEQGLRYIIWLQAGHTL